MASSLAPTIPAAQAWLNDAWVHGEAMPLLRRTVECLGDRGFKVYAGPMAPLVRQSVRGRSLQMAYLVTCADVLATLTLRWDLGVFADNIGSGRGEIALHLGNICQPDEATDGTTDLDYGESLLALLWLWDVSGLAASQRTQDLLADLQRHYEPVLAELGNGTFEQDLRHFVDTVDEQFQA